MSSSEFGWHTASNSKRERRTQSTWSFERASTPPYTYQPSQTQSHESMQPLTIVRSCDRHVHARARLQWHSLMVDFTSFAFSPPCVR